ncbi:Uncharacterized protein APZ42_024655 [Daphnia magna]|uniref:Uncharacterized protein n=1 Tax=Daphnia magna TaxID=35525 RepID=A0A164TVG1_9CRUS|nr:Uncharacterized protein APZ42_024655 [Daphnia magna]
MSSDGSIAARTFTGKRRQHRRRESLSLKKKKKKKSCLPVISPPPTPEILDTIEVCNNSRSCRIYCLFFSSHLFRVFLSRD